MTSRILLAAALAAALPALAPAPAPAQTAPDAFAPAAFVDGQAVTNFDVDQRARLLRFLGVAPDADASDGLQAMIDDRLKRSAAREAGIQVSPQDVEAGLSRFAAAQGASSPQALETRLRSAGVSLSAAREFVETEVMWTTLIRNRYMPRADISAAEVDEEIAAAGLDRTYSFDIGEIALVGRGDPDAVMADAQEMVAQLRAGADFAAVARSRSQSPSARQGGRIGWAPGDQIPRALRDILSGMNPGDVTDPLPVPNGVVVIKLFDQRSEQREISPEDRENLRAQILERRLSRLAEGRLQELRARAYVERR